MTLKAWDFKLGIKQKASNFILWNFIEIEILKLKITNVWSIKLLIWYEIKKFPVQNA